MTHDDIIRMAQKAGLTDPDLGECVTDYGDATEGVLRFAELVAAAEREACAQVAEKMLRHYTQAVTGVPEAIRARGEKNEP